MVIFSILTMQNLKVRELKETIKEKMKGILNNKEKKRKKNIQQKKGANKDGKAEIIVHVKSLRFNQYTKAMKVLVVY